MRKLLAVIALAAAGQLAFGQSMCFKSGEQVSGMNKICYYRCPTGTVAINVASYQLCPLTVNN
jgi:hypothetical protein